MQRDSTKEHFSVKRITVTLCGYYLFWLEEKKKSFRELLLFLILLSFYCIEGTRIYYILYYLPYLNTYSPYTVVQLLLFWLKHSALWSCKLSHIRGVCYYLQVYNLWRTIEVVIEAVILCIHTTEFALDPKYIVCIYVNIH